MLILKFTIPKLPLRGPYTVWRTASIVLVGAMITMAGFIFYFLYQSIYNTFANGNAIAILRSTANTYIIDLPRYSEAVDRLEKKQEAFVAPPNSRNIFSYSQTPAVYATSTKKK